MQVYLSRLEGTADNRDVEGSIPSTCTIQFVDKH